MLSHSKIPFLSHLVMNQAKNVMLSKTRKPDTLNILSFQSSGVSENVLLMAETEKLKCSTLLCRKQELNPLGAPFLMACSGQKALCLMHLLAFIRLFNTTMP